MRIGPLPSSQLLPQLDGPAIAKEAAAMPATTNAPKTGGAGGFGNILEKAVAEVDGKMQAASAETTKLLTGETTNVHQAVVAMQEASVAFSLMVEVRNKLVESYQELMRMQV